MRVAVAVVGLLSAWPAGAECPAVEQADLALVIVEQEAAGIQAARAVYEARRTEKPWDAYMRVGYAMSATQSDAQGLNASLEVKIPLFSNAEKVQAAKARAEWIKARDGVRKAFLGEVEQLCKAIAEHAQVAGMAPVYRDRLRYVEKRVNEDMDDPAQLWDQVVQVQTTERKVAKAGAQIDTQRQVIARRFGGRHWRELMALLPR